MALGLPPEPESRGTEGAPVRGGIVNLVDGAAMAVPRPAAIRAREEPPPPPGES